MSNIKERIENSNCNNQKALTIFLTSGYPDPEKFTELALGIVDSGADILEIGVPFGDSLADGPVIQASYIKSLERKINLEKTLNYVTQIREYTDVPIVLMTSSNPILSYEKEEFVLRASESGVDGVIVPDVPLEEFDDFFGQSFEKLDTILLTTPTSSSERIKEIDKKSRGFVYCVSVVGITGVRKNFEDYVYKNLKLTYNTLDKNKMQIGFGISSPENIKTFSPYCDGIIVGSSVIRSLEKDDMNYSQTLSFVKELKKACSY